MQDYILHCLLSDIDDLGEAFVCPTEKFITGSCVANKSGNTGDRETK